MFVIDQVDKTVTFLEEETLTLAQLWSLIELMDDEVDNDEDVLARLHPEVQEFWPTYMTYMESYTRPGVSYLVVQLPNGHWICSCDDFIKRGKDYSGETCKHIDFTVKWG